MVHHHSSIGHGFHDNDRALREMMSQPGCQIRYFDDSLWRRNFLFKETLFPDIVFACPFSECGGICHGIDVLSVDEGIQLSQGCFTTGSVSAKRVDVEHFFFYHFYISQSSPPPTERLGILTWHLLLERVHIQVEYFGFYIISD
jgi:hypothetical protein